MLIFYRICCKWGLDLVWRVRVVTSTLYSVMTRELLPVHAVSKISQVSGFSTAVHTAAWTFVGTEPYTTTPVSRQHIISELEVTRLWLFYWHVQTTANMQKLKKCNLKRVNGVQGISGNVTNGLYWMVASAKSCVEITTEFDELVYTDGFVKPGMLQFNGLSGLNTNVSCWNTTVRDDGDPWTGAFASPPTDIGFLALLQVATPDGVNEANWRPATRILLIPRNADAPTLNETVSVTKAPLVLAEVEIIACGKIVSSSLYIVFVMVMRLWSGASEKGA